MSRHPLEKRRAIITQYIVYNLAFINPKLWVEEEERKSKKGVMMTQYDCALCHLPTPSPLLLLSHLEVISSWNNSFIITI